MYMKEYISVAEWSSHNEVQFQFAGKSLIGKTPQYCESRIKRLFDNISIMQMHLTGWHMQIRTSYADNSPECDVVDVQLTILHTDIDTVAIESKYIHKLLGKTQISMREITDTRSQYDTYKLLK